MRSASPSGCGESTRGRHPYDRVRPHLRRAVSRSRDQNRKNRQALRHGDNKGRRRQRRRIFGRFWPSANPRKPSSRASAKATRSARKARSKSSPTRRGTAKRGSIGPSLPITFWRCDSRRASASRRPRRLTQPPRQRAPTSTTGSPSNGEQTDDRRPSLTRSSHDRSGTRGRYRRPGETRRRRAEARQGVKWKWAGPCPNCGGTDRFALNTELGTFNCRGFGGGDTIAMVQHARGLDFVEAVEFITGGSSCFAEARVSNTAPAAKSTGLRRQDATDRARSQNLAAEPPILEGTTVEPISPGASSIWATISQPSDPVSSFPPMACKRR